jgi:hypothetical protein
VSAARHPGRLGVAFALLAGAALLTSCTQVVRYTDELVDPRYGRTLFTRLPATVGATAGFAIGVPLDVVAIPAAWVVYRSQPRETRDPVSVFLFPSFVLWKVGALFGGPFDFVEWGTWRWWQARTPMSDEEAEAIERIWDTRLYFTEYPVTPIYPLPGSESAPPR